MAREYFNAYHSYLDAIEPLTDEERGRLWTAMLEYSATGAEPDLQGGERYVFPLIKSQIDRDLKKYEAKCEKNRGNVLRRYTNADERMQQSANATKTKTKEKTKTRTKTKAKARTKEKEEVKEEEAVNGAPFGASPSGGDFDYSPPRHRYGEFGWVRLTADEYSRLAAEYGEDVANQYITVVDELAQQTGNKNKWKDWNLTVRKAIRDKWGARNGRSEKTEGNIFLDMAKERGVIP